MDCHPRGWRLCFAATRSRTVGREHRRQGRFQRTHFLDALLRALVLVFFFPVVGWGFLDLAVTPKLIVVSAVPHLLFAIFLWGLCRWIFRDVQPRTADGAVWRGS